MNLPKAGELLDSWCPMPSSTDPIGSLIPEEFCCSSSRQVRLAFYLSKGLCSSKNK
jgi:hypothetical protein